MRKVCTLLTLGMLFFVVSIEKADARARIPTGDTGKVIKLIELPDEKAYRTKYGEHFDLGVKYTVFEIAWIPVYTVSPPELVKYLNKSSYTAIPLTEEEIQFIATANEIDNIHELAEMPFWDAWGGKFVMILIVIGEFIWVARIVKRFKRQNEEIEARLRKEMNLD